MSELSSPSQHLRKTIEDIAASVRFLCVKEHPGFEFNGVYGSLGSWLAAK
jgi:hypothetical protein